MVVWGCGVGCRSLGVWGVVWESGCVGVGYMSMSVLGGAWDSGGMGWGMGVWVC